jgi:TetR/AcrR family acrAB operon transcriptional repressor
MARRTKEEALVTRSRILDAAECLFQRHGVSQTSLQDIAQAAGVTRGAIYWHFEGKADLFNAMLTRVTLPLQEALSRSDDLRFVDPLQRIRDSFIEALRKTANDPQVRRVFEIVTHKVEYVDDLLAVRDLHLNMRNAGVVHAERSLRTAMRRGQLPPGTPAHAAALGLHALIDGLIQNWMLDPAAFDLVEVGEQALEALLAGLAAPTAPARREQ